MLSNAKKKKKKYFMLESVQNAILIVIGLDPAASAFFRLPPSLSSTILAQAAQ